MTVAIMQPYFFPYIGYFQLINSVDKFVVYDNIQYIKRGWINRNRILVNGKDEFLTIPLKKDSDLLNVDQRFLSESFLRDRVKLLRRVEGAYRKAPNFGEVFPLFCSIIEQPERNLFAFIYNSLYLICDFLDLQTDIVISSNIKVDHDLRGEEKVIAIATKLNADVYINPIGGLELYSKDMFAKSKIELKFLKTDSISYLQFDNKFVPNLSILDVLMFNSKAATRSYLSKYSLI